MIKISNLSLRLQDFALIDINVSVNEGDLFILVGPSGSGKTLLLETVAGLHKASSGRIEINGEDLTFAAPQDRGIGMVYQDCALFAHLTVAENIAFGLRVRRESDARIRRELDRVAGIFGLSHLLARTPHGLSGGEKQKVALARAIATQPKALLLDEPLSSLDPSAKESVRQEIVRLNSEMGLTVVHVTHDFEEAVLMGTRAAVIGEGEIRQVGSPDDIFQHPSSEFVARFTMAGNVFRGVAHKTAGGAVVYSFDGASLQTTSEILGECFGAIRPENILVSRTARGGEGVNVMPARVTQVLNRGAVVNVIADAPPVFNCLLTRHTFTEMNIKVGEKVYLNIPSAAVSLFRG